MRIEVDRNRCTGLGMCEAEAPGIFEVEDDGSLVVLNDRPGADQLDQARAAVESCPTEALKIVED